MQQLLKVLLPVLLWVQVQAALAQQITGTIRSQADNQPLTGVTVQVKGTTRGTVSNAEGNYTVTAQSGETLRFSFIGYKAVELAVPASGVLNVTLDAEESALKEVVVTALGIAKEKKSLGYSVQELKSNDVAQAREPNLVNALSGKIAGVNITNSQGNMGSSRIVIRGETSIAGNNQPLFIVDGIPVDNSQFGSTGTNRDYANAIADINPDNIESISVLKGPNAAALYGSRAANGVILIKTKIGRSGQQKGLGVTLNAGHTVESLLVLPDYQNVYGQGTGGLFSYKDGKGGGLNDGTDESWGPKMDGRLLPQFFSKGQAVPFVAHPDNVKNFFVKGHTTNLGVSVAGSDEKFDYRFSFNNTRQTGVIPNTDITKNNFAVNASYRLNDRLTINTSANFIRSESDNLSALGGRGSSVMLQFLWFGRQVDTELLKDYRANGERDFNWNHSYYSNPYLLLYENTNGQRRDRFFGNVNVTYKINDWLSALVRTGNDFYVDKRKSKISYGTNGTPFGSYAEDAYIVNENNTDFALNFNRKLSDDFDLEGLVGGNVRSNFFERNYQQAPRLAVSDLYTLMNSRDPLVSSNQFTRRRVYSLYASAQLGFRNYAFLNLTARNDWSSTLPAANNSYFYPSVNASVVLTEALNIRTNWLSFAKIRGGWAQVGKDTDPYQIVNTYPFNQPFGSNPLLTVSDVFLNPNLKPEITQSSEIGLEMAFLKNRARFDVSYYNTDSFNQILQADISPATGFKQQLINAGKINNRGFEVQLSGTPVQTSGGFKWNVTVNFSRNVSKVVELDKAGLLKQYVLGSNGTTRVLASVGQRYGALYGTAYQRNERGEVVVGANGLPQKDPNQKTLGYFTPKWIGGITNAFSYKGWNLSVLIDTKQGGQIYSATNATGRYTGVLESTLPGRDAEHGGLSYYYAGNNTSSTPIPVTGSTAPGGERVYSDGIIFNGVAADGSANKVIVPAERYYKYLYSNSAGVNEASVFDASFIKLREVRLTYAIPQDFVRRLHLQGASVSLIGRNLAFLQKNAPNIDPETAFNTGNAQGLESLQLPSTRSYGVNLNINF
ncbi:SusC/RagA family TonB-linked outer membrane protein [Siphonobacter sp. SORGH_AS_1065]|uniref:SusC/RagA family TonB-linked outer membrane protein n=1 Tax=Siphonobacter sp. SORGH_AS_1065 TaxID=3041795 RepID=UPI002781E021|nr:SusC/RagA family TonB-linked outer membrane protein [Siphonobacter sp. SORGH_AS_1065]MDQ1088126.1 TonB-linked SusC/RagA family outer membrane protein [Siphonobacter sp. SORGH_AS_1065]